MKSEPPSRALTSDETPAERLSDALSLHEATALLNDNQWSLPIDDCNQLAVAFDWNFATLNAFVVAANNTQDPARAPAWLRTRPPHITVNSFPDDVVQELARVSGDRDSAGSRSILVTDTREQFTAVAARLITLQDDEFMQTVAREAAFPPTNEGEGEPYLATTHCVLLTPGEERMAKNNLPPARRNGEALRQLFI